MIRFLFLLLTSLCFHHISKASDPFYGIDKIPQKLLKGADVVKRMEEISFEIINTKHTVLHYKYAFTILNENGDKYAGFYEYYDQLRKVNSIEGTLYDASGKVVKKLKNKDIQDLSAVDDISLIDDNRKKVHNFYHRVCPYTVEYEVQITFNHTFHFPGWITQEFERLSVENSSFTLITPADYGIRYRSFNYTGDPVLTTDKGKKVYKWQVKDISAIEKEYAAPRWHELTTMVSIAPTEFEIEGYKGNMSSWKEFGKFLYELKRDRDALPESIKNKVHQIADGLSGSKEKVKALYQFLQQNTRYISIQLGIGGWQPFEAADVAKKGYGDCKALSNYMYSLLKEAGIKSYYALIKAGKWEHFLHEDLPSNQFNHAILCVPSQKDTIWLECTSQIVPAGYMGEFTGNRKALLLTEEGGVLVNTPRYGLAENRQVRKVRGKVDTDGTLAAKISTSYNAVQQDDLYGMINSLSKEKVKKILQEELDFATYNINDFKYKESKDILPQVEEELDITIDNYATITGKRLFITPNLLNRTSRKINKEERHYEFSFDYAYQDVDSVEIEIPNGYEVESLPKNISINNKYGLYISAVKIENNKMIYYRILQQFTGRFSAKEQNDIAQYFDEIYKADRSRIVLVKKGE